MADRGGWREETFQRPEIQASFLFSGELLWTLLGVSAANPPANPFSKPPKNFGGFYREFSWRIFLGTFCPQNEAKKSGDKIRDEIWRLRNKNPRRIQHSYSPRVSQWARRVSTPSTSSPRREHGPPGLCAAWQRHPGAQPCPRGHSTSASQYH